MGVLYRLGREGKHANKDGRPARMEREAYGLRQRGRYKLIGSPNTIAERFYFDDEVLQCCRQQQWEKSPPVF